MSLLYNAGIGLYAAGAHLAAIGSDKVRKMIDGQAETFDRLRAARTTFASKGFDVWIHAASLGEFEQARPMIDRLLAMRPKTAILLTFFSPSGYTVRNNYHPHVAVTYLPFDLPGRVNEFLDIASPRMAVFVKYEFWGNYLSELHRRSIPTYLISGIFRPTQRFFKAIGGEFRDMLHAFTHMYVQDEGSRKLLAGIGLDNVTVAGDTRFDRVSAIRQSVKKDSAVEAFMSSSAPAELTMVIGSSWSPDEDIIFPWLTCHPEVRAIIAPHEFDAARIEKICKRLGDSTSVIHSHIQTSGNAQALVSGKRYLIIDCFGLLSSLYSLADIAYVGGGFGTGIHNINEAAAFGIPVIFGPKHHKFKEASDLISCGGAFSIAKAGEFARIAGNMLTDKKARTEAGHNAGEYINSHIGATDIIMRDLFGL